MENKIKIAISGAGNRSKHIVDELLKVSNREVEIVAIFDPDKDVAQNSATNIWKTPNAKICSSWTEALACDVNWAMIFSPNYVHKEQILEAFAAGKHVFSEKPLATKISDCHEIYKAHLASNKLFATGFVLRYSQLYIKAKEILSSGLLGKLVSIEANENIRPQHGGYIMSNWRRLRSMAGPHILEKCCHDLDLIEWFCESIPSKISAFHSRSYFKPENKYLEDKYGKDAFICWNDPHRLDTPFNDEADLHDNLISVAQFRNGVQVSFNCSMSSPIPERRMRFNCTEGTMYLDVYNSSLTWKNIGDNVVTTLNFSNCDGHAGGDFFIMKELYETMTKGTAPKCSGQAGLLSAVYALAIDEAALTEKIVDLEDVWKSLGQ